MKTQPFDEILIKIELKTKYMINHRLQNALKESFSKSTRETWKQAAMRETDGSDPFEKLKWKISDELKFYPYYDQEDLQKTDYLKNFQLPSGNDLNVPRACANIPKVTVTNAATANHAGLQHLNGGADGLLFSMFHVNEFDINALLENIEWPYCHLLFEVTTSVASSILGYITNKKFQRDSLTGILFWNELPKNNEILLGNFQEQKGIATHGIIIPSASPVDEIADALTRGVKAIDILIKKGIEAERCFPHITFSINTGTAFFIDIAKLKALRILWFQIAQAYGVTKYQPYHLQLHARSEVWIDPLFQPQGNLLKSTTAGMAAILGGADAISILPEDENNTTMNRMARNTLNILKEESHFDKVSDPLAGCYAVENIVHALAEEAWRKFKTSIAHII